MERVNWDNQSVPPKIIPLAGKLFFNRVLKWWRHKNEISEIMGFVRIFWKNNVQEAYLPKMSISRQIVSEIVAQLYSENSIQTLLIFLGVSFLWRHTLVLYWWRLLVDKNGSFYADAVSQGFHSSVIKYSFSTELKYLERHLEKNPFCKASNHN